MSTFNKRHHGAPCKKHEVVVVRSWVSTFVLVDLIHKDERWTFPLNGGVIDHGGSSVQPCSILIGTVHCMNGHRPSRTHLGPIVLEGTRPSNGHGPQGIRPPRDKGLSILNTPIQTIARREYARQSTICSTLNLAMDARLPLHWLNVHQCCCLDYSQDYLESYH